MEPSSLSGVRIWLSGSIPDEATLEEAQRIRDFVSAFAQEVFRWGGHLVHGSHPTIREALLQAAQNYKARTKEKAGLTMVVSRLYSKEPDKHGVRVSEWNDLCVEKAIQTREAPAGTMTGEVSKEKSLEIMRHILVEQCNAIVSVGGKWWKIASDKAGTPKEIELARKNQLPLFLLGGLGGATRDYLKGHSDLLRQCNNGLSEDDNLKLSEDADPAKLSSRVINQLLRLPLRWRKPGSGRPFRILCLDGGGIRGAFTAAVLKYWEQATGLRIVDHFDLIAGTSTGGILAIGIGLGMSAADMLEFYNTQGSVIFPIEGSIQRLRHSLVRRQIRSRRTAAEDRRSISYSAGQNVGAG
jgi:hypothetical protein